MNTRQLGKLAENYACGYLAKSGYTVISRNWTCYAGEIDIIASKKLLVFVEVKSVSNANFVSPYELFHHRKKRSLLRAINIYLQSKHNCIKWRVDLLCLVKNGQGYSVSHYENVME